MKILMVTRHFSPEEPNLGGVENYLSRICSILGQTHQVSIFSYTEDRKAKNYSLKYSHYHAVKTIQLVKNYIPPITIIKDPLFFIRDRKVEEVFAGLLEAENPEIVHIHQLGDLSFGLIEVAKKHRIPVILTLHDFRFICDNVHLCRYQKKSFFSKPTLLICNVDKIKCEKCFSIFNSIRIEDRLNYFLGKPLGPLAGLLLRVINTLRGTTNAKLYQMRMQYALDCLNQADLLIAPSDFVKTEFSAFINPQKIRVIPHGVNINFKNTRKSKLPLRFGYIGGVLEHKGIDFILEAFSSITPEEGELYLYGPNFSSGSGEKCIQKYAKHKNIKFMGTFTDAKEAFSDLDILVLPSLCKETFSLAAHEAFAANIPVIAPAIGAFPDYIQDNYNSLLFVPGCKESLMEKMRLLINRPDLIETYKNNMFQPKTLEEHVQSIIEAYQKQTKING